MGASVEMKFVARDLKQAARMQQQFVTQMDVIGYQCSEFRAVPGNGKVDVILTFVRRRNHKTAP